MSINVKFDQTPQISVHVNPANPRLIDRHVYCGFLCARLMFKFDPYDAFSLLPNPEAEETGNYIPTHNLPHWDSRLTVFRNIGGFLSFCGCTHAGSRTCGAAKPADQGSTTSTAHHPKSTYQRGRNRIIYKHLPRIESNRHRPTPRCRHNHPPYDRPHKQHHHTQ